MFFALCPYLNLTVTHHRVLRQILHIGPGRLVFAHLERVPAIRVVQQIHDALVVDLQIADGRLVRGARRLLAAADAFEQRFACARNEPWIGGGAHHGVGFAAARLAVGEHTGVVS